MTIMPQDFNSNPIPVLTYKQIDGTHVVPITSSSGRNSIAFNANTFVISIYATVDCFIEQGTAAVTSSTSRHFIPAGIYIDIEIGGGKRDPLTHLAVIRSGAIDGTLYISERQ